MTLRKLQLVLALSICLATVAAKQHRHFEQWFTYTEPFVQPVIEAHCDMELKEYVAGDTAACKNLTIPNCLTSRVVHCTMENLTGDVKAMMAASTVLLGLLPTVLGLKGSTATEMGFLVIHRPFLGLLLGLGAPAVYPARTFTADNPLKMLGDESHESLNLLRKLKGKILLIVLAVQYILALGAATNIVNVCLELGNMGICSFASETTFLPLVYFCFTVVIHAFAAYSVTLRVEFEYQDHTRMVSKSWLWSWIRKEATLCKPSGRWDATLKAKSLSFAITTWTITTVTLLQLIFGTLVLSATLFVATEDAAIVGLRFLVSDDLSRDRGV